MTEQILVRDQILLKDSFAIWKLRRGDGPGGEVGSSSKVSVWLQLEIDTRLNQKKLDFDLNLLHARSFGQNGLHDFL